MHKNVITLSESYRRTAKPPFAGHQKGDAPNLVSYDRLAGYREREYLDKFGELMREWVALSEDWRAYQDHPMLQLEGAFNAFKVATANHSGVLQRSGNARAEVDLRRVRRVVELSDNLSRQLLALSYLEPLYGGKSDNRFVSDEIDDCFVKIDEIVLKMEDEFGLILHKRLALPAPS